MNAKRVHTSKKKRFQQCTLIYESRKMIKGKGICNIYRPFPWSIGLTEANGEKEMETSNYSLRHLYQVRFHSFNSSDLKSSKTSQGHVAICCCYVRLHLQDVRLLWGCGNHFKIEGQLLENFICINYYVWHSFSLDLREWRILQLDLFVLPTCSHLKLYSPRCYNIKLEQRVQPPSSVIFLLEKFYKADGVCWKYMLHRTVNCNTLYLEYKHIKGHLLLELGKSSKQCQDITQQL